MNISVTTNNVEFHDIDQLLKFKSGIEVEMLVWISSFCILTTNIAIVRYAKIHLTHCHTQEKNLLSSPSPMSSRPRPNPKPV